MMIFGVCFFLYLIKLSAGKAFCNNHMKIRMSSVSVVSLISGS